MSEYGLISRFERDAVLVLVGTSVANVASYGYHVLVSRNLGPTDYGATAAILGVGVVAGIPAAAMQYAVARRVADGDDDAGRAATGGALRLGLTAGLLAAAVIAVASPVLATFLKTHTAPVLWAAAWMVPLAAGPSLMGRIQGQRRFAALATCITVAGLSRVVGAAVVVLGDLGVSGAVAAMAGATLVTTLLALVLCGADGRPGALPAGLLKEIGHTTLPLAAFSAIAGMDVVLARHYLSPRQSGFYAAASVAGKIVLWAPAAVAMTAFPEFAAPTGDPRVLTRAVRLAGAICAVAVLATVLGKRLLIGGIFGNTFLPAADVVLLVALAMSALAILQVVTMWAVARRAYVVGPVLVVGAAGIAALLATFNGSPRAIGTDLVVGIPVLLAVVWLVTTRARSAEEA